MADAVATTDKVELDDRTAVRVEVSKETEGVVDTVGVLVVEAKGVVVLETS